MYRSIPSFTDTKPESPTSSLTSDVEVSQVGEGISGALTLVLRRVREAIVPSKKNKKLKSDKKTRFSEEFVTRPAALKPEEVKKEKGNSANSSKAVPGSSYIHIALAQKDVSHLRLLLQNNINPDVKSNDGRTALHEACFKADTDHSYVKLLLEYGADPNVEDNRRRSPLHLVLLSKPVCEIKLQLLVKSGASISSVDADGVSSSMLFYEKMPGYGSMDGWIAKQNAVYIEKGLPTELIINHKGKRRIK